MSKQDCILVAEDDENDILLLQRALEEVAVTIHLAVVRNGRDAIDYLAGMGVYANREKYPAPLLLLLDLHMPLVDGFEVLTWWQSQEELASLPVIVMSSSNQPADLRLAMDLGAVAYRVKPANFQYLVGFARELRDRWLGALAPPAAPEQQAIQTREGSVSPRRI